MKRIILNLFFLLLCTFSLSAQKGTSRFALVAGYENFPELWAKNGYNIGLEYKYYVHQRVFVVANFHAGVNDGDKETRYMKNDQSYRFTLHNSVRDYMVGFGLGADLLQIKRHTIYLQGTAGLGASERKKDGITLFGTTDYDVLQTFTENSTRFAISVSMGYDYRVTDWLAVGVNYTGFQVGYEYNNACNLKLSLLF